MLRFSLFDGGVTALLNKISTFQSRYVAREIEMSDEGKPLLHLHLKTLSGMGRSEVPEIKTPSGTAPSSGLVSVDAKTMNALRVKHANPSYPAEAKFNRVQGTVELKVIIGTDGRIRRIRPVSSPDTLLTLASISALERWVYKPYLVDGKPVSVETTLKVVFNLGG